MNAMGHIQPGGRARSARRCLGVQQILEWAFGREHVRLETEPCLVPYQVNVGTEYVIMERMQLGGVRIDTSRGMSCPHADAETVAAIVANLPSARGGLPMAFRIADLARAGITPDWMPGARPRLVPADWKRTNQFCRREGRTEVAGVWTEVAETRHPKNPARVIRRTRRHEIRYTPCLWRPGMSEIAAARRRYLDWVGALMEIRGDLQAVGLSRFEVSDAMPPLEPWKKGD